jgi:hypothetical protein
MIKTIIQTYENPQKEKPFYWFFRVISKLIFHPGAFYKELPEEGGSVAPLIFLFLCSVFFSIFKIFYVLEEKPLFFAIYLLNAFSMPFVTAFFLYLVTLVFSKNTFSYWVLFSVTAYANVTLLATWIPGFSYVAGFWKFYLIGLGMVKVGRVRPLRAFSALLTAALVLILVVRLSQAIMRG